METIKALTVFKGGCNNTEFQADTILELTRGLQSSSKLFRFMEGWCEISKNLM